MSWAKVALRPSQGIHDAEAIGADEAGCAFAKFGLDGALEGGAVGAHFFEAGGDDDDSFDAGCDTFGDQGGDGGRGRDDDG